MRPKQPSKQGTSHHHQASLSKLLRVRARSAFRVSARALKLVHGCRIARRHLMLSACVQVYFRSDDYLLTDVDRAKRLQLRQQAQADLQQQIEAKHAQKARHSPHGELVVSESASLGRSAPLDGDQVRS